MGSFAFIAIWCLPGMWYVCAGRSCMHLGPWINAVVSLDGEAQLAGESMYVFCKRDF